ncbi:interleukin-1 receptor-like 2 [Myxocyprinus asiaticus]|uniref:interleukin-1 receptor-like 2 n=1 Tax=Myxocyprinus asiaticus TaxID=70543 RepID=UPI002223A294|nr:interleukin-1 receptor-like 2 [Myxocyprinus asiaticus]
MAGLYTCFVTFTFEGQNYTSAQTTLIKTHSLDDGFTQPTVIFPKNETHSVKLGESFKLTCKAFIGKDNIEETMMYWSSDSESINLNNCDITDGKSYDAYVSYLHGDQLSLSSTMTFALHFLPAVLEDLYGYKLFISGRDEIPGEAVQDAIADRMNQCRRLIIVLTSQSFAKPQTDAKKSLLSDCELAVMQTNPVQLWGTYEQRVGLYDALVKEGLKVILVQVDDGVEESLLPESLRYISRNKGILKWRTNSSEDSSSHCGVVGLERQVELRVIDVAVVR